METRDKIKELIKLKGLTQREVARRMGISYSTFRQYMCGIVPISNTNAKRMLAAIDAETVDFDEKTADYHRPTNVAIVKCPHCGKNHMVSLNPFDPES